MKPSEWKKNQSNYIGARIINFSVKKCIFFTFNQKSTQKSLTKISWIMVGWNVQLMIAHKWNQFFGGTLIDAVTLCHRIQFVKQLEH